MKRKIGCLVFLLVCLSALLTTVSPSLTHTHTDTHTRTSTYNAWNGECVCVNNSSCGGNISLIPGAHQQPALTSTHALVHKSYWVIPCFLLQHFSIWANDNVPHAQSTVQLRTSIHNSRSTLTHKLSDTVPFPRRSRRTGTLCLNELLSTYLLLCLRTNICHTQTDTYSYPQAQRNKPLFVHGPLSASNHTMDPNQTNPNSDTRLDDMVSNNWLSIIMETFHSYKMP